MKKNLIEYTFKRVGDRSFVINYTIKDKDGNVVAHEAAHNFRSNRGDCNTMNAVRTKITKMFRNLLFREFNLDGKTTVVCLNEEDDFYTRKEMCEYNKANEVSTPVEVSEDERVFEVVQILGVWTIIKHDEPLYTKAQAQKVLMEHIFKGDK